MSKKRKSKTNPRNQPCTRADIDHAKRQATDVAITYDRAMYYMVLRDKFGFSNDDLARLCREIDNLADSIDRGYCKLTDIKRVLLEESHIDVNK